MKHLLVTLFGAEYAKIRQGVNLSHILSEETRGEDNYRFSKEWWDSFFPDRLGVSMGEVLAAAGDDQRTSPYMCDIVLTACYKVRGKSPTR